MCRTPRHVLEVFSWFAEHEKETGLRVMTRPSPRPGDATHEDQFARVRALSNSVIAVLYDAA